MTEDCSDCHAPGNFATGLYDHTVVESNITLAYATCHNNAIAIGTVGNHHIPTVEDRRVCHDTTRFEGATFDHSGIISGCEVFHDGTASVGKVDAHPIHIPTTDECSTFAGGTFTHVGIARGCVGCHSGQFTTASNAILGKPTFTGDHFPMQQDCYFCNNFLNPPF